MNLVDFLKELFCFETKQPGDYLNLTHIIIASAVTFLTVLLGVCIGVANKNKSEQAKTKLIRPFAIIMWILYAIRIAMIVSRGYYHGENGLMNYVRNDLPLFLCDIQFFALIAVCYGKGKLKRVGMDLCICLGMLSFIMGVWLNAGTFSGTPWWGSSYFYEMIIHAIPGGISIYILFSRLGTLRLKNIWATLLVLFFFEAIALTLDYTIDSNYMFFRSDAGTPFSLFRGWAGSNDYLYSFYVWLGMAIYIIIYYLAFELVITHLPSKIAREKNK